jgi:NodT family efflux transporter outer membrane factor (OMF) lipoprotein
VRVTLVAEVATTYLQLRTTQARAAIARQDLASQERTWKIDRAKFNAGLGDEVVLAQQAAQVHVLEAALPPLLAAERTDQHALALMLGEDPEALTAELSPVRSPPPLPPEPPVGVPSDLLRRRPDIRQAERNLAAATAQIGVATAQLFPQFSITGSYGLDSSSLKQLPAQGSQYYSIAPGISWPILDWAPLHAAIRAQDERQVQAALAYRTAVAQALSDVADALVRYQADRTRHAALVLSADQAHHAQRVAAQIYASGLADQLAALEADRAYHQAQDQLAQNEGSLRTDVVGLYKALGGGW